MDAAKLMLRERDVTRVLLQLTRLHQALEAARDASALQAASDLARQQILHLGGLPDVDPAVRGQILAVLEEIERQPSSEKRLLDQLAEAVCACNRLVQ